MRALFFAVILATASPIAVHAQDEPPPPPAEPTPTEPVSGEPPAVTPAVPPPATPAVSPPATPTAAPPAATPPTPSAAPGGSPTDTNDVERAREHMERGQEAYLQSRFEEAAREFQRAYEIQPFSAFLYNAAVAYERNEQFSDAARLFSRYLASDASAPDSAAVRGRINRLRASAGEPPLPDGGAPDAPPGENEGTRDEMKSLLSVRTNPSGATVRVSQNGQEVATGESPFAQTLSVGSYELAIEHPDFRTVEETITIRPGEVYNVIVEMSQGTFLGFLRVVSDVPGARVYVDDRAEGHIGETPFANVLPTGPHRIWVERPGYQVIESEVEVGLGEHVMLRVDLERVDFGRIKVNCNVTDAEVYVDGELMGQVEWTGDVPVGTHTVRVEGDGMKDFEAEVDVRAGQLTPVRARLRPSVGRAGAWITAFMAAAFVGGGVVLGLLTSNLETDLQASRDAGTLAQDDSRFLRGTAFAIGADVAFGLGAVLGVLSLYYFLRDPLPDSEGWVTQPRDWTFTPQVSADGGGAQLRVSF